MEISMIWLNEVQENDALLIIKAGYFGNEIWLVNEKFKWIHRFTKNIIANKDAFPLILVDGRKKPFFQDLLKDFLLNQIFNDSSIMIMNKVCKNDQSRHQARTTLINWKIIHQFEESIRANPHSCEQPQNFLSKSSFIVMPMKKRNGEGFFINKWKFCVMNDDGMDKDQEMVLQSTIGQMQGIGEPFMEGVAMEVFEVLVGILAGELLKNGAIGFFDDVRDLLDEWLKMRQILAPRCYVSDVEEG